MNSEIQLKLAELKAKGWSLASIARELGIAKRTVESWNQGIRNPANLKPVLDSLNRLNKRVLVPKKKLYPMGSRNKAITNHTTYNNEFNKPID